MRLDQGRTPAEALPVVAARHPTARLVLEYLVLQGHTRAAQAYARDVAPIARAPHLPPAEVQRMRVRQRMWRSTDARDPGPRAARRYRGGAPPV